MMEKSQYGYQHQIEERYLKQMKDHFDRQKVSDDDDELSGPQNAQGRFREADNVPRRASQDLRVQGATTSEESLTTDPSVAGLLDRFPRTEFIFRGPP